MLLLKKGSRGSAVRQLQEKLGIKADGIFGQNTENAVKAWQKSHGLTADGIVGKMTWGKLFAVPAFDGLEEGDLEDDDDNGGNIDDGGDIDGLDLSGLKGVVPDSVIAQISECAKTFAINTPLRIAHFLAQCAHESGGFRLASENLNYSAAGLKKVFPALFPGNSADSYAKQPQKIASRVYANKLGNGDEASGDGWKYRGRGYIQLTGKSNYSEFDATVGDNIVANPDLVATKYPLLSAAWFWNSRHLNALADGGAGNTVVEAITEKVNGKRKLGLAERIAYFKKYYALLA